MKHWIAAIDWWLCRRWVLAERRLYEPYSFGKPCEESYGLNPKTFKAESGLFDGKVTHLLDEVWRHPNGTERIVKRGRWLWNGEPTP